MEIERSVPNTPIYQLDFEDSLCQFTLNTPQSTANKREKKNCNVHEKKQAKKSKDRQEKKLAKLNTKGKTSIQKKLKIGCVLSSKGWTTDKTVSHKGQQTTLNYLVHIICHSIV